MLFPTNTFQSTAYSVPLEYEKKYSAKTQNGDILNAKLCKRNITGLFIKCNSPNDIHPNLLFSFVVTGHRLFVRFLVHI
jgi:hypothetical protein